jgi:hypothetical protein
MASQARQENFSRTCAITFHWRGISSSVSVTSSPILRSLSSPQHGQTGTSSPNSTLLPRVRWPTVRVRLADLGVDIPPPDPQTPEALGALQKSEIEKWWPIIKVANILGGVRPDARTKPQGLECCDAQAMTALGQFPPPSFVTSATGVSQKPAAPAPGLIPSPIWMRRAVHGAGVRVRHAGLQQRRKAAR